MTAQEIFRSELAKLKAARVALMVRREAFEREWHREFYQLELDYDKLLVGQGPATS